MKHSKEMDNRNEIQSKLKQVLAEINHKYNSDIESKFIITLGDEFQGLLGNGVNTMNIVFEIEKKMYPVRLRFGIGIGKITTEINKEMALGADGPGYYKARTAVEYLKDNEKKKQVVMSDARIEVEGDNQSTVIMLEHQDSQINVAKRLNIKQPAVQKSFSSGKYYAYKEAIETITKALEEIRRVDV